MFEKVIVIDGRGHLMGRLASIAAKEIMNGQNLVVVRCEELNISGSRERGARARASASARGRGRAGARARGERGATPSARTALVEPCRRTPHPRPRLSPTPLSPPPAPCLFRAAKTTATS
jgi:hypothetical protein